MKNTNSRRAIASLLIGLCALPLFAGALTSDEIRRQIDVLLAQLSIIQQQIQIQAQAETNVQTVTNVQAIPQGSSGIVCPVFNNTFGRGYRGGAVTELQKFLIARGFLTADSATGYFGPRTEAALQAFQSVQGIVSSGTAATTGWGVAGPLTRATITRMCAQSVPSPTPISPTCPTLPTPTTSCATGWQAVANASGCTMSYQCSAPTTCSPGYALQNGQCITVICAAVAWQYPNPASCAGTWQPTYTEGCQSGWKCMPNTSCPVYSPPLCNANQHLVGGAYNSTTGCYGSPQCVAN